MNLDFQVKIPIDMKRNVYNLNTMLDPLCNFKLWPQARLDTENNLNLKDTFWKIAFLELIDRSIWNKRHVDHFTLRTALTLKNDYIWIINSDIISEHGLYFHD